MEANNRISSRVIALIASYPMLSIARYQNADGPRYLAIHGDDVADASEFCFCIYDRDGETPLYADRIKNGVEHIKSEHVDLYSLGISAKTSRCRNVSVLPGLTGLDEVLVDLDGTTYLHRAETFTKMPLDKNELAFARINNIPLLLGSQNILSGSRARMYALRDASPQLNPFDCKWIVMEGATILLIGDVIPLIKQILSIHTGTEFRQLFPTVTMSSSTYTKLLKYISEIEMER